MHASYNTDMHASYKTDMHAWFKTNMHAWYKTDMHAWYKTDLHAWYKTDMHAWSMTCLHAWCKTDKPHWVPTFKTGRNFNAETKMPDLRRGVECEPPHVLVRATFCTLSHPSHLKMLVLQVFFFKCALICLLNTFFRNPSALGHK